MSKFNFAPTPPKPGPELPLLRVLEDSVQSFTILSTSVLGIWCHWNVQGKCGMPCTLPVEQCLGHTKGWPLRWKGFLHVGCHTSDRQGFLELTPRGAVQLKNQVADWNALRGWRVQLTRTKGGKKGRLLVVLMGFSPASEKLPDEKSPLITLEELWGRVPQGARFDDENFV